MNDEKFELTISDLAGSGTYYADIADELRARDTAQRDALVRVEAELSDIRHKAFTAAMARDTAQEQIAEALGLLRKIADWPNGGSQYGQENIKNAAKAFLARHAPMPDMTAEQSAAISQRTRDGYVAQAEQQEARQETLEEILNSPCAPCEEEAQGDPLGLAPYASLFNEAPAEALKPDQKAQGAQAGDERAAFERFIRSRYPKTSLERIDRPGYEANGEYESSTLHVGWIIWQARAALATQPAEWIDPCPLTGVGKYYDQGFADGVAEAKRLNAVRGAEHE